MAEPAGRADLRGRHGAGPGDLGLADQWADLGIATWNATLNYGPGWEDLLLDAYGVAPDAARTRYYRLLGRCY